MFTGIVEEQGTVRSFEGGRLDVSCRLVAEDSALGSSIAVNGTCLSVVERRDDGMAFDVSEETLARTTLGDLGVGARVNLERPATLSTRLGGHLVQGHVDGVGSVEAVDPTPDGGSRLHVGVPWTLSRYAVEKGSVAIDGVSLTVAAIRDGRIEIALIPHTLTVTTLGAASVGTRVNLEMDLMAKYVERLLAADGKDADDG